MATTAPPPSGPPGADPTAAPTTRPPSDPPGRRPIDPTTDRSDVSTDATAPAPDRTTATAEATPGPTTATGDADTTDADTTDADTTATTNDADTTDADTATTGAGAAAAATGVPPDTPSPPERGGFWARNWQKVIAALIWVGLVAGFLAYSVATRSTPTETLRDLVDLLRSPWGPLIYIAVYAIRPLAFFSAVVVTLLGGAIWGPFLGLLYVIVGSNLSATIAYGFGRVLGRGVLASDGDGSSGQAGGATSIATRYADRLRRNAFVAVLLMRLVYLPYDLVNYVAGFLRVRYAPFITATILGSLPGTLTFVLAGASLDIDDVFAGRFDVSTINPLTLALSAALFVGGLLISRLLRRREEG